LAILVNVFYSLHVQDRWNMWLGGPERFTDRSEIVWLRSWHGDERTKTDIGWYWYRGQHLSMDYVPIAALSQPESRVVVGAVLENAQMAEFSGEADFTPLRTLALKARSDSPFDWYLGIPLHHAWSMWWDIPVRTYWNAIFQSIYWRVPYIASLLCGVFICVGTVLAFLRFARTKCVSERLIFPALMLVIVSRTAVFAATVSMPESRYMIPTLPTLLVLCLFGWASIRKSRTDSILINQKIVTSA